MRSLALALAAVLFLAPAQAHEVRKGALILDHPWARASIGTARPGAAYVTVINEGKIDDALIGAESPLAARVHVHETVKKNGVMRMVPRARIAVPAGGRAVLEPGGAHLMLMGLKKPLEAGGSLPLTLIFEKAGRVTLDAMIESVGASTPMAKDKDHMQRNAPHGGH